MPGGAALTRPTLEVVGPRKRSAAGQNDALSPAPLPQGEGENQAAPHSQWRRLHWTVPSP